LLVGFAALAVSPAFAQDITCQTLNERSSVLSALVNRDSYVAQAAINRYNQGTDPDEMKQAQNRYNAAMQGTDPDEMEQAKAALDKISSRVNKTQAALSGTFLQTIKEADALQAALFKCAQAKEWNQKNNKLSPETELDDSAKGLSDRDILNNLDKLLVGYSAPKQSTSDKGGSSNIPNQTGELPRNKGGRDFLKRN